MALNWSFKARLYNASDLMKNRYVAIRDELTARKKLKVTESWDKVRFSVGRKTYASMFFRGKTLCLALALDPAQYAETKYIFDDMSEVARFASTPMVTKMTSERQLRYLWELFAVLFAELPKEEVVPSKMSIPFYAQEELIDMELIKVTGKHAAEKAKRTTEPAAAVAKPEPVAEPEPVKPEPVKPVAPAEPKPTKPEPKPEPVAAPIEPPKPAPAPVEPPKAPKPVAPIVKKAPMERKVLRKAHAKSVVNIGTLARYFGEGETVTLAALKAKGVVAQNVGWIKILGGGTLVAPLTVEANAFSRSALVALDGKAVLLK